ncbi:MAG: hypothetical protein A2289_21200 [Deltaproteobacteria bacterium RIFOXYA12_FULL_58_15]|nr:MAG: hypothetical protein A2289_21200 [Deltaproteobacteria bacterium RIFOXYA12_FULL_58_15]OGR08722.1 MAG: hypothetical protein A2341_00810 [Deltaproteobacteria bacterium RIFOXYB12_FULL_58_9]
MNDSEALTADLQVLTPSHKQSARMKAVVDRGVEAAQTALVAEWLEMLRVRPVAHTLYAVGAAALLLLVSPLGSLPLALFGGGS